MSSETNQVATEENSTLSAETPVTPETVMSTGGAEMPF